MLLLPWAIAPVVTGVYWRFIFQGNFGIVNGLLTAVGVDDPPIWLNNGDTAMAVAVVANVWRSLPLLALILLAALKGVPQSLYRAAALDGARPLQSFRFVTLPSIKNALIVVIVLQLILSLQVFDIIFTLTGGGPGDQTRVISYHIYLRAFGDLSFGYSAALAVILLLLTALPSARYCCCPPSAVGRARAPRGRVSGGHRPHGPRHVVGRVGFWLGVGLLSRGCSGPSCGWRSPASSRSRR